MSRRQDAQAANLVRSQLASFDWAQADLREQRDGWGVYLCDHLDYGMAYVEPAGLPDADGVTHRIAISREQWTTFCYHAPAVDKLFEDMALGGSGMKFIVDDVGPFAAAVRARGDSQPGGPIAGKDAITDLAEQAQALVVQAASLNRRPSELQQATFAVRYARLREYHADIVARVAQLDALLDLAGTALFDAAS